MADLMNEAEYMGGAVGFWIRRAMKWEQVFIRSRRPRKTLKALSKMREAYSRANP